MEKTEVNFSDAKGKEKNIEVKIGVFPYQNFYLQYPRTDYYVMSL